MFKPTKAKTMQEYLKALAPERRKAIEFLHTMIPDVAPTLKSHFAYNMLGYGSFPWRNSKKEMIEWPVIGLASQKQYISLYICSVMDGKYLAEVHKDELGNVSVGKSCIRFKKIDDLDLAALKKLIRIAAKNPGLAGLSGK